MRARNYYRKRRSPWPGRIAAAVLAVAMAFAAVQLIGYAGQMLGARNVQAELLASLPSEAPAETPVPGADAIGADVPSAPAYTAQPAVSAVPLPTPTATLEPWKTPEILFTYHALWEENNDLVGWLNIDRLYRVDFAVVQRDQSYYLRRDFYGRSNMNGTAFLDVTCDIWPRSDNLVIYAHNMKSGEMFGGLHRLLEEPYYREAPLTTFNTIYERASYVPVAAMLCSIRQGENYFNFCVPDFAGEEAFNRYIARAGELSAIDPPYDAVWGDQLLTLVTCWDGDDDKRVVVILRRVRWCESEDELAGMWQ